MGSWDGNLADLGTQRCVDSMGTGWTHPRIQVGSLGLTLSFREGKASQSSCGSVQEENSRAPCIAVHCVAAHRVAPCARLGSEVTHRSPPAPVTFTVSPLRSTAHLSFRSEEERGHHGGLGRRRPQTPASFLAVIHKLCLWSQLHRWPEGPTVKAGSYGRCRPAEFPRRECEGLTQ